MLPGFTQTPSRSTNHPLTRVPAPLYLNAPIPAMHSVDIQYKYIRTTAPVAEGSAQAEEGSEPWVSWQEVSDSLAQWPAAACRLDTGRRWVTH